MPLEPGKPCTPPEETPFTPGTQDFLPHPIGQEENPDVWEAWTPLMLWLLEHSPDHYHKVCVAEEAIRDLERRRMIEGQEYTRACQELLRRFETARRLALSKQAKVWIQ